MVEEISLLVCFLEKKSGKEVCFNKANDVLLDSE